MSNTLRDTLKRALPDWHFELYGKSGAVVCYPPAPQRNYQATTQAQLKQFAPISGIVSGDGIVVCRLNQETAPAL